MFQKNTNLLYARLISLCLFLALTWILSSSDANASAPSDVYRFWSETNQGHFYTASEEEKNNVVASYPQDIWKYEGVSFQVFAAQKEGTVPVYRFWSDTNRGHFYTVSENEKNYIVANYSEKNWRLEGIAWYAFASSQPETSPIYRFWSKEQNRHFFTGSLAEKTHVQNSYAESAWKYEGIAYWTPGIAPTAPNETIKNTVVTSVQATEVVATKCTYPSQILSLTNWKQTLPIGSSESPTEIKQTSLASYVLNPYFFPNSNCNGVVFRAPVNGVTTSGSGYPRSELREMTNEGKSLASWSTTSGTHSMFIDQAITAVPKTKKHVVAGQIHDSQDDVIVIRLEYPKLFVDINGTDGPVLDSNYTLGKRFTVKFVASNGKIDIFYNGKTTPSYSMNKSGSGNYFKAGAYTQSNCSKESDCSSNNFGEVVIYKLEVK